VARVTIKGIEKNTLHILPQWDAKFAWVVKRMFPRFFFWFNAFIYRHHIAERIFGLDY
jgi:hypothetical protein